MQLWTVYAFVQLEPEMAAGLVSHTLTTGRATRRSFAITLLTIITVIIIIIYRQSGWESLKKTKRMQLMRKSFYKKKKNNRNELNDSYPVWGTTYFSLKKRTASLWLKFECQISKWTQNRRAGQSVAHGVKQLNEQYLKSMCISMARQPPTSVSSSEVKGECPALRLAPCVCVAASLLCGACVAAEKTKRAVNQVGGICGGFPPPRLFPGWADVPSPGRWREIKGQSYDQSHPDRPFWRNRKRRLWLMMCGRQVSSAHTLISLEIM